MNQKLLKLFLQAEKAATKKQARKVLKKVSKLEQKEAG